MTLPSTVAAMPWVREVDVANTACAHFRPKMLAGNGSSAVGDHDGVGDGFGGDVVLEPGLAVGVEVRVEVGLAVGDTVDVADGEAVDEDEEVFVAEAVGVAFGDALGDLVADAVGVAVADEVGDAVAIGKRAAARRPRAAALARLAEAEYPTSRIQPANTCEPVPSYIWQPQVYFTDERAAARANPRDAITCACKAAGCQLAGTSPIPRRYSS